ncbi:MAG TPA: carboxypeptidase-like regulatory domain-containing protein [Kofleriaceae bacterium]|nr:carboxypeptidase-like regulatory domain-containing protein [Kofleriaceae bacterium]
MRAAWLVVLVAACGASSFGAPGGGDAAQSSDGPSCTVTLAFAPTTDASAMPIAPTTVRATATVDGPGFVSYAWTVTQNGLTVDYTSAAQDNSAIDFDAATPGSYHVVVELNGGAGCPDGIADENVGAPGAQAVDYRLRVWPSPALAPTQEQVVQVEGGADFHYNVTLDPGLALAGTVTNGATGVPAYLRFMPVAAPDAYVEAFAASDGTFALRVLGQAHQVLIVPAAPGTAPALVSWSPGTTTFALGAGTAVTGTVVDGSGAALAGATVQLASGGVPSTLATTASDGSFTVHETFTAGATVAVAVVPPPGRGLPKLAATAAFDLTKPMQIHYATIATTSLAGTAITRGGANQPGAQVAIVGTLAATAGTVVAGTTSANATGTVAIAATADATGKLPATLAPRASLSAVIAVTPGDLAVAAIDLTGAAPASIDAPAQVAVGGVVLDPSSAQLVGVQVDASGDDALAAAGVSDVQTMSGSSGTYTFALAAGGTYDLHYNDPQGRAAPVTVASVAPASPPATVMLAPAIHMAGSLAISGSADPVVGASVQILCTSCSGIAASRPLAETASDGTSSYQLAVPDPGTM